MAKTIITTVELTDDLDGGKAERTIAFSFDGVSYKIDLAKKNASAFEKAMEPYLAAARKTPTSRRGAGGTGARKGSRRDLAAIRAWAKENGHEVSDRGRVAASVIEAYDASS